MKEAKEGFEEIYRSFVEDLKAMPNTTREEKEKRYEWFTSRSWYGEIVLFLLEQRNSNIRKVLRGECKAEEDGGECDIVSVRDRKGKKKVDTKVFMEALQDVVWEYTGKNAAGEPVEFGASMGRRYQQLAEKAKINREYEENVVPPVSKRQKERVYKLAREARWKRENGDGRSVQEIMQALVQEKNIHLSENDISTACFWAETTGMVRLDAEIESEEDGLTVMDTIPREDEGYGRLENRSWICTVLNGSEEQWGRIKAAAGKVNFDIIKAFMTRDILIALKLKAISELTPEEERCWGKVEAEPKCKDWCSAAESCKKEKAGCYTRYTRKPAGDGEVYALLAENTTEQMLFRRFLHKPYLDKALPNHCFRDVYENLLYPLGTFDFLNKTIAEALCVSESAVSKGGKKYREEVKNALWKEFRPDK